MEKIIPDRSHKSPGVEPYGQSPWHLLLLRLRRRAEPSRSRIPHFVLRASRGTLPAFIHGESPWLSAKEGKSGVAGQVLKIPCAEGVFFVFKGPIAPLKVNYLQLFSLFYDS